MTVHEVTTMAAQGDVILRRVDALPPEAKRVKRKRGAPIVVAHSETKHHHVIEAEGVVQFEIDDPLVCYLQLDGIAYADLVHQRSYDTHATLRLLGTPGEKTIFQARRQREYVPSGFRQVQD